MSQCHPVKPYEMLMQESVLVLYVNRNKQVKFGFLFFFFSPSIRCFKEMFFKHSISLEGKIFGKPFLVG